MTLTCREAGGNSLAVLGEHASEAQRLELEDHLSACRRCDQEHARVSDIVRGLKTLPHDNLTSAAREKVRRSLVNHPRVITRPRPRRWSRGRLLTGIMMAMAASVGSVVVWRFAAHRGATFQVLGGDVVVSPVPARGAAGKGGATEFRTAIASASESADGSTARAGLDRAFGFGRC